MPLYRSRRLLLLVLVALTVGCLALALTWDLPRHRANRAVAQTVPGPVVLVPGYGSDLGVFARLEAALKARGRTFATVTLPAYGHGDLTNDATALDAVVSRLEAGGAPSVDIVGYSAGGLVARLWVLNHDGAHRARRIITLATPHHGTSVASLGDVVGLCDTACRQMQPGSALLARLNRGDETPPGPQWMSLWTSHDGTVVPPESSRLAGAVDVRLQDVCPGDRVTHAGVPADPAVVSIVVANLGPTGVSAPRTCPLSS